MTLTQIKSIVVWVLGLLAVIIGALKSIGITDPTVRTALVIAGGVILAVVGYLQTATARYGVATGNDLLWNKVRSIATYVIGFALAVIGAIPAISLPSREHVALVAVGAVLVAVEHYLQGTIAAAKALRASLPDSPPR